MGARFITVTATGFGSGFAPFAPGTMGTIVGIPIYLLFSTFSWPLFLASMVALAFFAVYVSQEAEKLFGERDPSRVVIDEIVGFQVTLFLIDPTILNVIAGFAFFRFFDILKPFPIRFFERRLPGGYGVVGDDVMAGIYGNILLQIMVRLV